jgi:hypothetical protein
MWNPTHLVVFVFAPCSRGDKFKFAKATAGMAIISYADMEH